MTLVKRENCKTIHSFLDVNVRSNFKEHPELVYLVISKFKTGKSIESPMHSLENSIMDKLHDERK